MQQGYWHTHRLPQAGSRHANHTVLPNALPRQSEHQPGQLLQRDHPTRVGTGLRPNELSQGSVIVQPASQPDSDFVVHEHLHSVGPSVSEAMSVVRMRRVEHGAYPREHRVESCMHVQPVNSEPRLVF